MEVEDANVGFRAEEEQADEIPRVGMGGPQWRRESALDRKYSDMYYELDCGV